MSGAAQESNLPTVGLPRPAGFEDVADLALPAGLQRVRASLCAISRFDVHGGRMRSFSVRSALTPPPHEPNLDDLAVHSTPSERSTRTTPENPVSWAIVSRASWSVCIR